MQTIRKQVTVSAPAETVFRHLTDPALHTEMVPAGTHFQETERLPGGGCRGTYTCRVLGLSFSGILTTTDVTPNERIIWSLTGDLQGTVRWYLSPTEGESRTQIAFAATYSTPGPSFLQKVTSPLFRRYTNRKTDVLLQNVRARIR